MGAARPAEVCRPSPSASRTGCANLKALFMPRLYRCLTSFASAKILRDLRLRGGLRLQTPPPGLCHRPYRAQGSRDSAVRPRKAIAAIRRGDAVVDARGQVTTSPATSPVNAPIQSIFGRVPVAFGLSNYRVVEHIPLLRIERSCCFVRILLGWHFTGWAFCLLRRWWCGFCLLRRWRCGGFWLHDSFTIGEADQPASSFDCVE